MSPTPGKACKRDTSRPSLKDATTSLIPATNGLRRSEPITITKDSAREPAFVAAATWPAARSAEREEGCAIIILPT
jgi:hypothetical protein